MICDWKKASRSRNWVKSLLLPHSTLRRYHRNVTWYKHLLPWSQRGISLRSVNVRKILLKFILLLMLLTILLSFLSFVFVVTVTFITKFINDITNFYSARFRCHSRTCAMTPEQLADRVGQKKRYSHLRRLHSSRFCFKSLTIWLTQFKDFRQNPEAKEILRWGFSQQSHITIFWHPALFPSKFELLFLDWLPPYQISFLRKHDDEPTTLEYSSTQIQTKI